LEHSYTETFYEPRPPSFPRDEKQLFAAGSFADRRLIAARTNTTVSNAAERLDLLARIGTHCR
jgi:hypothetical protein